MSLLVDSARPRSPSAPPAAALLALLVAGCATDPAPLPPPRPEAHAREETLGVVRRSLVQRVVREAPAVTRSGVARLVTMVPLDEDRRNRLATAVSRDLSADRLEDEVGRRLEDALDADDLKALGDALAEPAVAAVIDAAVVSVPDSKALEHFVEDEKALPEARRARVKALVDLTWSAGAVDRLTRAPVSAAARIVAAALKDDEVTRRADLLAIAQVPKPGDPDQLVVAFAFLWKDLDDDTLDAARAFFASELGVRSTSALVDGTVDAVGAIAASIEHDVSSAR